MVKSLDAKWLSWLASLAVLLLAAAAAPATDEGELDFLSTGGVVPSQEPLLDVDAAEDDVIPADDDEPEAAPIEPAADEDDDDSVPEPAATPIESAASLPASAPGSQPQSLAASEPAAPIEPWLAGLPVCLSPLAHRQLALSIKRDEKGVVIDHSCPRWGVAPILLRNVVVTGTYEGAMPADRRARLTFKNGEETVSSHEVQIGDQMTGGAIVVAVGPGLVLLDSKGTLVAATDGVPVKTWRMIWHSGFVVASDGNGGIGGSSPAAGAVGKDLSRDSAKAKAKAAAKVTPKKK